MKEIDDKNLIVTDEDGNIISDQDDIDPRIEPQDFRIADDGIQLPQKQDDDAFAVLQRNFDALKQDNAKKDAQLKQHQQHADASEADRRATNGALLQHGLEAAKTQLEAAKATYATAMAAGDHAGAANSQELIANAVADVREYAQALEEFQATPAKKPTPAVDPAVIPHNDAVDQFIGSLTPKSQEFARKYRDKIFPEGDQKPFQQVLLLDQLARTRGITLDSPEYFNLIEQQMGFVEAGSHRQIEPPKATPKVKQRRPAMAAAPANQGGRALAGDDSVSLSESERRMAKKQGMTPTRYAFWKKTAKERANDPDYNGPRYSQDDPAIVGNRR